MQEKEATKMVLGENPLDAYNREKDLPQFFRKLWTYSQRPLTMKDYFELLGPEAGFAEWISRMA
jgi:hypothetical protein